MIARTTFTQIIKVPIPKTFIMMNIKIVYKRTFGLSIRNMGPATVKLANCHGYGNYGNIVCKAIHDISCRKVGGSFQYEPFNIKYKQSES